MDNKIISIKNVRAYQDEKGVAQLNLEDIARGLGFVEYKNEIEYIMWRRVNHYLNEFNFDTSAEKEYIPENIFYKLCFKAKNEIARRFQDLVTDEVLPSIRKTGGYIAGEENMTEDELILKAMNVLNKKVENLRNKNEQLTIENTQQKQILGELKPKADYLDQILQNKALVTTTAIAKDYGMSAKAFNKKLHELKVQFKQGRQWFLYSQYHNCGYTHSETIEYEHKDGRKDVTMNTKWTQKGRLFLYELLKKNAIVPSIEK